MTWTTTTTAGHPEHQCKVEGGGAVVRAYKTATVWHVWRSSGQSHRLIASGNAPAGEDELCKARAQVALGMLEL